MKSRLFIAKGLLLLLGAGAMLETSAQGCSDAGFCTMEAFKPGRTDTVTKKNYLKTGISAGQGDFSVAVTGLFVEFGRTLHKNLRMDVRMTALRQQGNGITATGLSDIYVSAGYNITAPVQISIGAKLPFNSGNRMQNGLALPMDYQSSLGTVDLITGISARVGKLQLAAAWQQPLTQNENAFNPARYPAASPLRKFANTNGFRRSGDMLLRATYAVSLGKSFTITPGLLPVFHLGNDRYTDAAGTEQTITGSKGLTLNGNLFVDYRFNDAQSIQLTAGAPFVVRDIRPDGLTRSFVLSLEYQVRF